MKLYFKERFSFFGKFEVFNEYDEKIFTVIAEKTLIKSLKIYNFYMDEVGELTQRKWSFKSKFDMYKDGLSIGTITKETTLKDIFTIDYCSWRVEGDFSGMNYRISDEDNDTVARIRKKMSFMDTYEIDVVDENDSMEVLMVVLAIDTIKAQRAATSAH